MFKKKIGGDWFLCKCVCLSACNTCTAGVCAGPGQSILAHSGGAALQLVAPSAFEITRGPVVVSVTVALHVPIIWSKQRAAAAHYTGRGVHSRTETQKVRIVFLFSQRCERQSQLVGLLDPLRWSALKNLSIGWFGLTFKFLYLQSICSASACQDCQRTSQHDSHFTWNITVSKSKFKPLYSNIDFFIKWINSVLQMYA